jgi:hypothetical protein
MRLQDGGSSWSPGLGSSLTLGGGGSINYTWFKMLSLLIGVPCLLKDIVGLSRADQFYRWRQAQYASKRPPATLVLVPVAVVVTWYATPTKPSAYWKPDYGEMLSVVPPATNRPPKGEPF